MDIINWQLAKHPINWIIIFLMILLFGIALHLVLDFFGVTPAQPQKT